MAKKIVYLEDNSLLLKIAKNFFIDRFPNYSLVFDKGDSTASECADRVLSESGGIEKIALIITDGDLLQCKGWNVTEELRKRGYKGKAIYVGGTVLPERFKSLYNEIFNKAELEHLENLEID